MRSRISLLGLTFPYWRNLQAFSIAPLMVYPTHYTGEPGYISDTESSEIVPDAVKNPDSVKAGKGSKEAKTEQLKADLPAKVPSAEAITVEGITNEFHTEL